MKLILDVKTNRKMINPSVNDLILYNGTEWYITTKQDLFKEYDQHFADKLAELETKKRECDQKMAELDNYKVQLAEQMNEYISLIRELVAKESE